MQELGQLLLILTFAATVATAVTAIAGATTKRHAWMRGARHGLFAVGLLTIAMSIVLTHGFLTHDYSSRYIYEYSERAMPLIYKLASFWGGERGALLFWVTSLAIFSNLAVYFRKDRSPEYLTWVTALLSVAILFFLVLMVFQTSPFDTWMAQPTPEDGRGLNPLLQNPVMAFHPPALLMGYILFTIPFAFGMAALITNKLDDQWIADTRRWTIISWTFLSVGLLLGCRWAYMEIGWGFWWMWDAVENAGLIPWFTATAFLHSVMIQERRGMLKRWNVILLSLTFLLTIVGTWMTRSQIIVSIHSFADSELSDYFLWYGVAIIVFSTWLIAKRWKALRSEARIESFMSREAMFVLNNVVLVFCFVITLYGTLMGKFTESEAVRDFFGLAEPIVSDEEWFNGIFVWIGLALLAILGIGPLISWRRSTAKNFRRNFMWPLAWGSLFTLVIAGIVIVYESSENARIYAMSFGDGFERWANGLDMGDWVSAIVYWMCAFVLFSVAREFHVAAKVRKAQGLGGYWGNNLVVMFKNPRRYGGYIVHIGAVFMFLAFTGKAFKHEEKDRLIAIGDTHILNRYSVSLVDRDHRYSTDLGCFISDATFVAMSLRTTVAASSVERLEGWLAERSVGTFHVQTALDDPKMAVRVKDDIQKVALLTDYYFARQFRRDLRQLPARDALSTRYSFADGKLVESYPDEAMRRLREARAWFQRSKLPVSAELTPGTVELTLRFANAEAQRKTLSHLEAVKVPEWVLAVHDDAETGALHVVDRHTGQIMVPESRFYPSKSTSTTEVAISGEDFLVDLYLSMQPDMGKPYVKVMAVIFPLVNFLWIGALLLLLGALIALTPRWLGRTLASLVAGHKVGDDDDEPGTRGAKVAGGLLLIFMLAVPAADSHERGDIPEPFGFAPPVGDPATDLMAHHDCGCPLAPGESKTVALAEAACACPRADADRQVVADLMARRPQPEVASGRAKYDVLRQLVELDPAWEPRVRDRDQRLHGLLSTTRTTCRGEYLMTLEATRATCSHRMRWLQTFRYLLAAGVNDEDIFAYYLASNNATEPGGPWDAHVLRTSDERAFSWGLPAALTGVVVLVIGLLIARNVRRAKRGASVETERERTGDELTEAERRRLLDERELWEGR
jgi:cytochrome c-type biogenesis protein CcmF